METIFYLVPQPDFNEILFNSLRHFLPAAVHSVDPASIRYIFIYRHWKRAGTLGHEPDPPPEFYQFAVPGLYDVSPVQHYAAVHIQIIGCLVQPVKGLQKGGFTAAGGAYDATYLVVREGEIHVFKNLVPLDRKIEVLDYERDVLYCTVFHIYVFLFIVTVRDCSW